MNHKIKSSDTAQSPRWKTVTCRHWRRGNCQLGDSCNFRHDEDQFGTENKSKAFSFNSDSPEWFPDYPSSDFANSPMGRPPVPGMFPLVMPGPHGAVPHGPTPLPVPGFQGFPPSGIGGGVPNHIAYPMLMPSMMPTQNYAIPVPPIAGHPFHRAPVGGHMAMPVHAGVQPQYYFVGAPGLQSPDGNLYHQRRASPPPYSPPYLNAAPLNPSNFSNIDSFAPIAPIKK